MKECSCYTYLVFNNDGNVTGSEIQHCSICAAAPELLEALTEMVDYYAGVYNHSNDAILASRIAIAKATEAE